MRIHSIPTSSMLLPSYIIDTLRELPWIKSDNENIEFYHDDFIFVFYGVRGSTAFSGPDHVRYGSNTTSYQIWSPKLPPNVLYLGDGGSGVMEADGAVMKQLFAKKINPFTASQAEVAGQISSIINTYTHYHYDHLHLGAPLTGLFHANSIPKTIIGGDNPKAQFSKTFRRPAFPRDFGEIQAAYSFHDIADPRSSVIVFTPDGAYRVMTSSDFNTYLNTPNPQIRHNKVFYNLEDCVVVRCYPADHPDPCISFRYESYDNQGVQTMAFTYMTDHEIRETDDRNSYFVNHVRNTDVVYFDGQYTDQTNVPGFGHGRVEVISQIAARLGLSNVLFGHHDPKRTDEQIDEMVGLANQVYDQEVAALPKKPEEPCRIVAASDRMMAFIPGKERKRRGVVFGRMTLDGGQVAVTDAIGTQAAVAGSYRTFDLTQKYTLDDLTVKLS